jgi:hypothetical protein
VAEEEMSAPQAPTRSRKKLYLAAGIVVIVIAVLVAPAIVYGGFTLPVATVRFGETTGSLSATSANATVQTMMVYEYMFSVRSAGMVRTSDSDVSSSRGTANITMSLKLTNPSGQTLDLGNVSIRGGLGTRNHILYLGASEGVRVPGSYRLDIIITANVAPVSGLLELDLTTTVTVSFTV